ncbi:hypothetical protein BpHYR1_054389 [Brachionus plicatilis]|uniref:Uncharacterized protein n=1 Tax=Brachionus plicatilis TaxID=10195 RepID=A0A3M7QJB7_BRAPC|nr:hypothetical protein BpHYR1_054389 [Brachionus plicatilis]
MVVVEKIRTDDQIVSDLFNKYFNLIPFDKLLDIKRIKITIVVLNLATSKKLKKDIKLIESIGEYVYYKFDLDYNCFFLAKQTMFNCNQNNNLILWSFDINPESEASLFFFKQIKLNFLILEVKI